MFGAVFPGNRTVELMNFDDPTPTENDVIIEMKASGICGSDLKNYRGTFTGKLPPEPIIAGHEPCGVVVEAGSAVRSTVASIGTRVMVHHYKGCGCCNDCITGWTQMCSDREASYGLTANGGHAKYLKVPADTLIRLPDELSFEAGATISCGTGTAWNALRRMEYGGGSTVLVVGQGPVGLAVTQFAASMGGTVIALDVNAERLHDALEFGATHVIDTSQVDAQKAVYELTSGKGAGYVVETSGSDIGAVDSVRCASKWGTVVFVGMGGHLNVSITDYLVRKQLNLKGLWTFSRAGLAACAEYVAHNKVDVAKVFSHRWELSQVDEAYRLFDKQKCRKAVVLF
ncbi:iditol 2-dehydrogenase [Allopusillimonas ginsengisoli]|nr:iditol 2-dehydrogenase [Allopusillimonas ginsengisoli]